MSRCHGYITPRATPRGENSARGGRPIPPSVGSSTVQHLKISDSLGLNRQPASDDLGWPQPSPPTSEAIRSHPSPSEAFRADFCFPPSSACVALCCTSCCTSVALSKAHKPPANRAFYEFVALDALRIPPAGGRNIWRQSAICHLRSAILNQLPIAPHSSRQAAELGPVSSR